MSDLVIFSAAYDDLKAAEEDYEGIKALHSAGKIGSYDSAIISRDEHGKVTVTKTEKPVEHGAWIGLAAGAAVALVFPVALPAVVIAGGAGLGAWIGHLAHGTSRSDGKELGAMLEDGKAALIVVATDEHSDQVEQALTHSTQHVFKEVTGVSREDAEREAIAALEETEKTPAAV
jgi:uncharacterized membrane protein